MTGKVTRKRYYLRVVFQKKTPYYKENSYGFGLGGAGQQHGGGGHLFVVRKRLKNFISRKALKKVKFNTVADIWASVSDNTWT